MDEIWKPIIGYEDEYEISNLGRIRRIRTTRGSGKGRLLKTSFDDNRNEYIAVTLYKDGNIKSFGVHRLVAITFIPNPDNKPEVNHINGIKSDNRAENLEWATSSENRKHAFSHGLYDMENFRKIRQRPCSESTKQKLSIAGRASHLGHRLSDETKRRISESRQRSIWVNNGIEVHRVQPEVLSEWISNGYTIGFLNTRTLPRG